MRTTSIPGCAVLHSGRTDQPVTVVRDHLE